MPTTDQRSIRVLLVDDHRTVLWGLGKLIDSAKPRMHVVGTAVSADEALALAVAERPDVVLLDLDLGGSSGLEILSDLLGRCDAKVLILTGARPGTPGARRPPGCERHGAQGGTRGGDPQCGRARRLRRGLARSSDDREAACEPV